MPTYQLSTHVYLDSRDQCYKKIIIINIRPVGALQNLIRQIQNKKLSPFQQTSPCCPDPHCLYAIKHPNTGELLCMKDIAVLFSFLASNNYTIESQLTNIMLKSTEKLDKLICFISHT